MNEEAILLCAAVVGISIGAVLGGLLGNAFGGGDKPTIGTGIFVGAFVGLLLSLPVAFGGPVVWARMAWVGFLFSLPGAGIGLAAAAQTPDIHPGDRFGVFAIFVLGAALVGVCVGAWVE